MLMTWFYVGEIPEGYGGRFADVCRRGLKANAGKSKVIRLNGEEGLDYEVRVDGIR